MVREIPERRRYGRIRLDVPLRARFGDAPVRVLEISIVGMLIAHEGRMAANERRFVVLQWDGALIEIECRVVRSTLARIARDSSEKSIYHSGLVIVSCSDEAFEQLRMLIAERILHALEQQKANARGIPPLSAYMYQPEKGDLYRRCELIDGAWRKSETVRPQQPHNGFTVSAEVDPWHVDMLCETWEQTTPEGRRLTQLLAQLSISKAEGVPVRRYVP